MNRIAKILYGALSAAQHDRLIVVWRQATGFGVYAHQVEGLPHSLDEFVDVKPLFGRDRYTLGDFITGKR